MNPVVHMQSALLGDWVLFDGNFYKKHIKMGGLHPGRSGQSAGIAAGKRQERGLC